MKLLPYACYRSADLREVRPSGWIAEYLARQCTGLTGHVEASSYPFGQKFWGSANDDTRDSYAPWWPYEQTAYWLDGALKCGYLVDGQAVYRRALEEIDFAIDHAAPDGFIGPDSLRKKDRWPHAVFFRAVLAQYEASGDVRYLRALVRHYRSMPHPMDWDRDVTGVEILVTLFGETGEPDLLELAETLYTRFNDKFPNHDCSLDTLRSEKKSTEHGVTFNEIAKLGALLYTATGNCDYLEATLHGYAKIDRDQLLADGLHSSSEHLRGRDPLDSHETCDISDYSWSLGYLLLATGNVRYADRIERVLFNAAPGAITKDFKALQYFSCPNQVIADSHSNHNLFMSGFNWMAFRPDHEVQCCPGNVHRAMPNYVNRMWMRDADGAIVAALYGPGCIRTTAGGAMGGESTPVTITAETAYPFEETITFTVEPARPTTFTFTLRIPAWCARPALLINDQPVNDVLTPGTFFPITREWQPGDRVCLQFPFELALERWPGGGVSVTYGPLTLSLPVAAHAEIDLEDTTDRQRRDIHAALYTPRPRVALHDFSAWKLTPVGPWNYALCIDESSLQRLAQIEWRPRRSYPLDPGSGPQVSGPQVSGPPVSGQPVSGPLTVRLPARRVRGWDLIHATHITQAANWVENGHWKSGEREIQGDFTFTPPLPAPETLPGRLDDAVEWIELVPYGATLLRMTVFPQGGSVKAISSPG